MAQRRERRPHSPRGLDRTHYPRVGTPGEKSGRTRRSFVTSGFSWKVEGLSIPRALTLIVVVGFLIVTLATPMRNYFEQRTERSRIETLNSQYRQENKRKEAEIARLKDPDFLDQEARRRLLVVPRGETAYRVVEPSDAGESEKKGPDNSGSHVRRNGPWYSDLWHDISTP